MIRLIDQGMQFCLCADVYKTSNGLWFIVMVLRLYRTVWISVNNVVQIDRIEFFQACNNEIDAWSCAEMYAIFK